MPELMTPTPVVMSINCHDSSGGGGISADIETLASLGCHCCPIISQITVRDTVSVKDQSITDSSLLIEQIRAVLEDINVSLIKVGELPSITQVQAIHTILSDYPNIPMVLHTKLAEPYDATLSHAVGNLLLPQAKIISLDKNCALALTAGADTLAASAAQLMEYGCEHVFISSETLQNQQWFARRSGAQHYSQPSLGQHYLGASDTQSAALSGYLAHGLSVAESIQQAQQFTWRALQQGRRVGMGQLIPDRLHWCKTV